LSKIKDCTQKKAIKDFSETEELNKAYREIVEKYEKEA
jgi:hypothetical protein